MIETHGKPNISLNREESNHLLTKHFKNVIPVDKLKE